MFLMLLRRGVPRLLLAGGSLAPLLTAARAEDVITYHYDAQRTGFNSAETVLTQAIVASPAFHRLRTVPLVTAMDAQPLVISAATLAAWGYAGQFPHDVVYQADEANNVFAIDSSTGAILLQKNFGTPVAQADLSGQCGNNAGTVGINSTPVIDPANRVMYFTTYTWENNAAVYRIHEMNLLDLSEKIPSVVITAKARLSNGSAMNFAAGYQRQRSALLFANGNLYAGFASFCDSNYNVSRGWMLGWKAGTLAPLAGNLLVNRQTNAQSKNPYGLTPPFFLSSIWMSGYGAAADSAGNVYFQTGNSDASRTANLPDSLVRMKPDLSAVVDYFTPANFAALDAGDADRGSGGVLIVPSQANGLQFAVSDGKDGRLFLHNRAANLGGFVANGPDVPSAVNAGQCWCGPAYFVGADGNPRIVSTGGTQVATWLLPATATGTLTQESVAPALPNRDGADPGFMVSTSANGTAANSAVIWAVSRFDNGQVYLQALAGTPGGGASTLYDRAGNAWSFGASTAGGGYQILINGTPAFGGYAVDLMTDSTGTLWQMNTAGNWWTYNGNGGWTGQGTTPNFAVPSPAGRFLVPSANTAITDGSGNVWTFGAAAGANTQILLNGLPAFGADGVQMVIDTTGTMWYSNSAGGWWYYNGNGGWTGGSGPNFAIASPAGTFVTPSGGGLATDRAGRAWSFGPPNVSSPANYEVLINGAPAFGAYGVQIVIDTAGTMWHTNAAGGWWYYNGNGGWVGAGGPTLPKPWAPGATVTAPGRLPRLQIVPAGLWPLPQANNNLMPVVANGKVYVSSYGQMQIWGVAN